jgi:drug/metabolite transporter (DMT)-like permease
VLLGELPELRGLGGITLVVAGVYLLNFSERRAGLLAPFAAILRDPGARRMLAVALIWSVSAVVDKVATISSSPSFYGTLESGLIALAFVPLVMRRGEGFRAALSRKTWWLLAVQGLLFALMFVVQMEAIQRTLAAYVISIKRSGAIVTVLLGALLFGEPRLRERLTGAVVILAGVLLIAGA